MCYISGRGSKSLDVAIEENNESRQSQHIEVQEKDEEMIKEEPVNLEDSISIKEEPLV